MKNVAAEQFVRFFLGGIVSTLVNYGAYAAVVYLGGHYVLATTVGFFLGTLTAYFFNTKMVFIEDENAEKRVWWKVLLKAYATAAVTGLLLVNLLLFLWLDVLKISQYMGEAVSSLNEAGVEITPEKLAEYIAPCINLIFTVPANFFINKFWTYRQKNRGITNK